MTTDGSGNLLLQLYSRPTQVTASNLTSADLISGTGRIDSLANRRFNMTAVRVYHHQPESNDINGSRQWQRPSNATRQRRCHSRNGCRNSDTATQHSSGIQTSCRSFDRSRSNSAAVDHRNHNFNCYATALKARQHRRRRSATSTPMVRQRQLWQLGAHNLDTNSNDPGRSSKDSIELIPAITTCCSSTTAQRSPSSSWHLHLRSGHGRQQARQRHSLRNTIMAIAASGAVSLSDFRTEFVGGSAAISLGDLYRGGSNIRAKAGNNTATNLAANVPTSGAIDFATSIGTAKGFRKLTQRRNQPEQPRRSSETTTASTTPRKSSSTLASN